MGSHKRGLLKGDKFNGKHSTVIKVAEPIVAAARELDAVTKILPGKIESLGSGGGSHFRIRPEPPACLKVIVSGGGAVQTLRVYTNDPVTVTSILQRVWDDQ